MNIQVGIIGLGNIGHRFGVSLQGEALSHSHAYTQIPGVKISLGVDPSPQACQDFQRYFPEAQVYNNLADVPDNIHLDVVSICSPTPFHTQGVTAALAWQPRVILCEKPLAPTVSEAEMIINACATQGCILMTNYSRRWTPMLQTLKNLISVNGSLGNLSGACLRYNGGLLHNGTHWIDLLLVLFGSVSSAYCIETPSNDDDQAESIALYWNSGFTAYLLSVRETKYSIGEGEIWGSGGIVRYSAGGGIMTWQKSQPSQWSGFQELSPPEIICDNGLKGHILGAITEAVQLAKISGQPTCSGVDGILALQVVEMARKNRIYTGHN